jgi:hypothetical protein
MFKHEVSFSLPSRGVEPTDISIERNGTIYGKIVVSNQSIVWFEENNNYGLKVTWKKFDKIMSENGTKIDRVW